MSHDASPELVQGCPLRRAEQTRNLLIFAACRSLIYLAAPVLYVGIQPSLCNWLGASTTVANLPKTVYLVMWIMPVLVAWLFPSVAVLRRNLTICYVVTAAVLAVTAAALVAPLSPTAKIGIVILQSALCGAALPTAEALIWEMIGRGVEESRRGLALSLAFGIGPILAALSSLGSHAILEDQSRARWFPGLEPPWNFAVLFALAAPMMAVAAFLASRCIVPLPSQEATRQPFVQGVFGGVGNFGRDRILLLAGLATMLIYLGNTIDPNMNLYTPEVLGVPPEQEAGRQLAYRFGFKSVAGLLLGWLLMRTNPKAGVLVTACIFIGSLLWALVATGPWYLLAFGFYGAGELVGVYAPNYILSASRKRDYRQNMAVVTLLMAPVAPAGALFGWIADHYGAIYGRADGFKLSFALCAALMTAGFLIALFLLPSRPRPEAAKD